MQGRTLKIYVRGNSARALRSIEVVNWSGKAYMGNKSHMKQLREIAEVAETGIYLLLNNNDETGLTEIYIGETDTASQRIGQQTKKDWWETFVVFIGRDLTKAHVRYLENKLYNLAKRSVSTLKVMNEGIPPGSKLPESDQCAMEEFASNIIFVVETMGLGLFPDEKECVTDSSDTAVSKGLGATEGMQFSMTLPKDFTPGGEQLKATMYVRNGSYILKAGSPIRKNHNPSMEGHAYFGMRQQIVTSDAVTNTNNSEVIITNRDLEFKSPSAAGAIVRGRATNGRTNWLRIGDNRPFEECESEE
jgi:hypothetical protein